MLRGLFSQLLVMLSLLLWLPFKAEAEELRISLVLNQASVAIESEEGFLVVNPENGEEAKVLPGKYFAHVNVDGTINLENGRQYGQSLILKALEKKKLPTINKQLHAGYYKVTAEGLNLSVVNVTDLELFLTHVLPYKTMPVWPDEAIKAQAIAARTYAKFCKEHAEKAYDIALGNEELPYTGIGKRTSNEAITKLIKATEGEYLVDNNRKAIRALTTNSTGGKTDSAENVLGYNISYLQSVQDFDEDGPDNKWEQKIAPAFVQNLIEQRGFKVGKLESVRLTPMGEVSLDRLASGRVKYVVFNGDKGSATIPATQLQKILGLPSTLFDIETSTPAPEKLEVMMANSWGFEYGKKEIPIKVNDSERPNWNILAKSYHLLSGNKEERIIFRGKGKGSGLGLSGWGARGMANSETNNTYKDILAHYYPGTVLTK